MRETRLYLDHNASAPLLDEARDALISALAISGNPSSVHSEGRAARALLARARADVATLVGAEADAVVFTSGATEAAVTCLTPHWTESGRDVVHPRLAVIDTDHPCIREGGRFPSADVTRLPVDATGVVRLDALELWLAEQRPGIVAFCAANSETGVLQPVREIVERAHAACAIVVCDSVQVAGRLPVDALALGADAVIVSAHKIGGPKGIGAFALRTTALRPAPLLTGGAQETRQRAGTEATALVAAFGAAAREALAKTGQREAMLMLRDHLERGITALSPEFSILGKGAERLPQTVMFHHPDRRAETVQIAMDLAGIAVSAGSACSSGKIGGSFVLEAMARGGADVEPSMGGLRVSFGAETDAAAINRFLAAFSVHWARTVPNARERHVA
ncbi:cysteine desulfurase family protein [Aureimonas sp. AU22]|uniref:cysteine desulfurase family protein n=1 Tax=Aureimonas sp. AU22 TaxID=1638162 RepID=UPI000706BE4C|nr:aminotransferase class V-fold PLP-dependent enzyme [Aureimonas sp. AU22]BAT30148.1 putative cysteine desulfurase [Aureimonas sp. AU22]